VVDAYAHIRRLERSGMNAFFRYPPPRNFPPPGGESPAIR
jgi:hypothetical protein